MAIKLEPDQRSGSLKWGVILEIRVGYTLFFLEMFDSDSILEKIDSFGRRIGILNRFFAIRFLLEPILNGQNRNRNGPAIKRF